MPRPRTGTEFTRTIKTDRIFDEHKLQSTLEVLYGSRFKIQKNAASWVILTTVKFPIDLNTKLQLDGVIAI